jgi:hypothetical protein
MDAMMATLLQRDAPDLLISFAKPFFFEWVGYAFMAKLLPNRLNVYAIAGLAFVYAVWINLRSPVLFGTNYHFWMNLFINAFTWGIILFLFKGKIWKRLLIWWYYDIVKTFCEAVAYVPFLLYGARDDAYGTWNGIIASAEAGALPKLLYALICLAAFLLFGFLSLAVWRRLLLKKFQPFYLLFIALPMGQRYMLSRVFRPSMGDLFFGILINVVDDVETIYDILSLFGIAVGLLSAAAILYYVLSYDKRAAIEAELRDAKRAMELDRARYDELERQSEELAKLRHDFNNQLASIVWLARVGEGGTAQEMISALSNEIDRTRDTSQHTSEERNPRDLRHEAVYR